MAAPGQAMCGITSPLLHHQAVVGLEEQEPMF